MDNLIAAKTLIAKGAFKEALLFLSEVQDKDQEAKLLEAIAYFNLKDYARTEQILQALHAEGELPATAAYLLAKTCENMGNTEKAAYFYKKAQQSQEIRKDAAKSIERLKQFEEADDSTEKIRELKPFKSNMSFKDVMGLEKQKKYLMEHVVFAMQHQDTLQRYGKKMGSGVLLYGPPGTGKTYLAKAVAGEAKAYIILGKVSQLLGQYMGVTERNISQLFKQARYNAPCMIFFDEIEALGGKRSSYGGSDEHGGSGAMKLAISTFLTEMQGMEDSPAGVFVLAATNRPWDMDAALKRSGRLSDVVYIGAPTYTERKASFRYHMKNKPHQELNYGRLARATIGYSQADIERICEEAALYAAIRDKQDGTTYQIRTIDLILQIEKVKNTIDEWYIDTRKELVGVSKMEKNGKKKIEHFMAGSMESGEKLLYKEMIRDVMRQTKKLYQLHKLLERSVALYLW